MQLCAVAHDWWNEEKAAKWIAELPYKPGPTDLAKLFLATWEQRVAAIRSDPKQAPGEIQEERLYRAVREALVLFREADWAIQGAHLNNLQDNFLQRRSTAQRPACLLEIAGKTGNWSVIVGVARFTDGRSAPHYLETVEKALEAGKGKILGMLLVHPPAELPWGKGTTRKRFEKLRDARQLRTFPLVNRHETHCRLLALLGLLDDARGQLLQLGEQSINESGCLALFKETGVLRNLDLFREVFEGWPILSGAGATHSVATVAAPIKGNPAESSQGLAAATVAVVKPLDPPAPPTKPVPPKVPPIKLDQPASPLAPPTTPPSAVIPTAAPGVPSVRNRSFEPGFTPTSPRAWAEDRLQELVAKLTIFGLPVAPFQPNGVEVGPAFASQGHAPGKDQHQPGAQKGQGFTDSPQPGFRAGRQPAGRLYHR